MSKRYSIAEARHNLAALVHDLAHKPVIELTRRGEPVAVLLSMEAYKRLHAAHTGFWTAYEAFRKQTPLERLRIEPSIFDDLRDRSPGREVRW